MITYEYFCEVNGQTIEVSHRMQESLKNWGELCQKQEFLCLKHLPLRPLNA